MPKTVMLSDEDLAALRTLRSIAADTPHPARPAAVALIDRINAAPEDGPRFPVVTRSGAQPLDLSQPDGYRASVMNWDNTLGDPGQDIVIPAGQDLHVGLFRPGGSTIMRWGLEAGSENRRALYRLDCSVRTRPMR